jgi:hypothetical protein
MRNLFSCSSFLRRSCNYPITINLHVERLMTLKVLLNSCMQFFKNNYSDTVSQRNYRHRDGYFSIAAIFMSSITVTLLVCLTVKF